MPLCCFVGDVVRGVCAIVRPLLKVILHAVLSDITSASSLSITMSSSSPPSLPPPLLPPPLLPSSLSPSSLHPFVPPSLQCRAKQIPLRLTCSGSVGHISVSHLTVVSICLSVCACVYCRSCQSRLRATPSVLLGTLLHGLCRWAGQGRSNGCWREGKERSLVDPEAN